MSLLDRADPSSRWAGLPPSLALGNPSGTVIDFNKTDTHAQSMTGWLVLAIVVLVLAMWVYRVKRRGQGVRGHDAQANRNIGAHGGPPNQGSRTPPSGGFGSN